MKKTAVKATAAKKSSKSMKPVAPIAPSSVTSAKAKSANVKSANQGLPVKPPVVQPAAAKSTAEGAQPLRFAHPFFTTVPKGKRTAIAGVGSSLTDHIQANLGPIPPPTRTPTFALAEIIGKPGSDAIAASGSIKFHTAGDTGHGANTPQGTVADAMTQDYDIAHPDKSPAFFFHLGDVVYGPGKDAQYRAEFYEPYVHYPGKIVAIPGNHDGEVFASTDPVSLEAFLANFCAPTQQVPAIAGTIFRETMNQPGVYYLLDAPFVQIVAMYSNVAENPGYISGTIPGTAQRDWLLATLKGIAAARKSGTRKALVFATHHPPFTAGGHSPSTAMLADIDGVCAQAGVMPDLYLSGHAHNYQRYMRTVTVQGKAKQIAYVVAGMGGISDQAVPAATGQVSGDHTYVKSFQGYGYVLVEVSAQTVQATVYQVDPVARGRKIFETFTVDLQHGTVA